MNSSYKPKFRHTYSKQNILGKYLNNNFVLKGNPSQSYNDASTNLMIIKIKRFFYSKNIEIQMNWRKINQMNNYENTFKEMNFHCHILS